MQSGGVSTPPILEKRNSKRKEKNSSEKKKRARKKGKKIYISKHPFAAPPLRLFLLLCAVLSVSPVRLAQSTPLHSRPVRDYPSPKKEYHTRPLHSSSSSYSPALSPPITPLHRSISQRCPTTKAGPAVDVRLHAVQDSYVYCTHAPRSLQPERTRTGDCRVLSVRGCDPRVSGWAAVTSTLTAPNFISTLSRLYTRFPPHSHPYTRPRHTHTHPSLTQRHSHMQRSWRQSRARERQ